MVLQAPSSESDEDDDDNMEAHEDVGPPADNTGPAAEDNMDTEDDAGPAADDNMETEDDAGPARPLCRLPADTAQSLWIWERRRRLIRLPRFSRLPQPYLLSRHRMSGVAQLLYLRLRWIRRAFLGRLGMVSFPRSPRRTPLPCRILHHRESKR